MVHFVGAGSGAPDLITVRGQRLLREADVVIYAGSLVNPALLKETKPGCQIHDSAKMTLEQVIEVIRKAEAEGKTTVRLHTGDPSPNGVNLNPKAKDSCPSSYNQAERNKCNPPRPPPSPDPAWFYPGPQRIG